MANIELTTATQQEIGNLLGAIAPPIFTNFNDYLVLPNGSLFYYKGEGWTIARNNQFGTIAAGQPWPTKGYWETFYKISGITAGVEIVLEAMGDIGNEAIVPGLQTITLQQSVAGAYTSTIDLAQSNLNGKVVATTHGGSFSDGVYLTSFSAVNNFAGSSATLYLNSYVNGTAQDPDMSTSLFSLRFYPPQA